MIGDNVLVSQTWKLQKLVTVVNYLPVISRIWELKCAGGKEIKLFNTLTTFLHITSIINDTKYLSTIELITYKLKPFFMRYLMFVFKDF